MYAHVQTTEQEQCTVQNYYTAHIPKCEHCPVEGSQNIMASFWKGNPPAPKKPHDLV